MSALYAWKEGAHRPSGVSAQVAGDELERLRKKKGSATPRIIVDDAARPRSPLHPVFEWDDALAADKFRLEQAGHLVRCVVYREVDGEPTKPIRAFVSVVKEDGAEYVPTVDARSDPALREQILQRKLAELARIRADIADFEEFADVTAAIDAVHEALAVAA